MQTLFPAIRTNAKYQLEVDDIHTLYIEECGNPDGIPIIVMHSGPGAGCEATHRRFFDPQQYRIILFDQRGTGRSQPHSSLVNNTTEHLVEDVERIRQFLKIKQWLVFGGAWGATLALVYAQRYPQHVKGLIVHSIFLGRKKDIDWFYQNGANLIFPDYWEDFVNGFSDKEQKDLVNAYHERLASHDDLARMGTAKSWSLWQARCTALQPHSNIIDHFSDPRIATSLALIETHYFVNQCFLEPNQILNNMDKLAHIPGYIIHGRYDITCPLQCAWELHQKWDTSELYIVRDAGHSAREPGIIDAIVHATKKMAKPRPRPA